MIILRQKNYSSPLTKALYGKEKLISGLKKRAAGLRTNLTRAVSKSPLSPKVIAAQELEKKTIIEGKAAAKRRAIQSKNKIKAAKNYIGTSTPGQIASDAIGEVVRRPVFVGSAVGGYAPLAYGVYIPGTTPAALALEEGVRKIVPGYAKVTNSLSKAYNKSGKRVVSNLVDSATKAIL